MSEILRWLIDDEQVDSTEILQVKLSRNLNAMEQAMQSNQAQVFNEIERADMYCTVCDKFIVGFNCGKESCSW